MREIKFRVVLKDKTIYEITSLHWYRPEVEPKGMCGATIKTESGHDKFIPIEDIEAVLEFTGLKDKNGKEIYEGDIVDYVLDDEHFKMAVEFVFQDNLTGYDLTEENEPEVLGNIYSNPELLKEAQQV